MKKILHWVIVVLIMGACAWLVLNTIGIIYEVHFSHTARHQKLCLNARQAFFSECFKTTPRSQCEALWAQKQGRVFDGSPEDSWVEEVDCSSEVK